MRMTYPTGGVACLDPSRFEDIEWRIVPFRGPIVPRVIDVEIVNSIKHGKAIPLYIAAYAYGIPTARQRAESASALYARP